MSLWKLGCDNRGIQMYWMHGGGRAGGGEKSGCKHTVMCRVQGFSLPSDSRVRVCGAVCVCVILVHARRCTWELFVLKALCWYRSSQPFSPCLFVLVIYTVTITRLPFLSCNFIHTFYAHKEKGMRHINTHPVLKQEQSETWLYR